MRRGNYISTINGSVDWEDRLMVVVESQHVKEPALLVSFVGTSGQRESVDLSISEAILSSIAV